MDKIPCSQCSSVYIYTQATRKCITCDDTYCEKHYISHSSNNQDHEFTKITSSEHSTLVSFFDKLKQLKIRMYSELEKVEKEIIKAINRFSEILSASYTEIRNQIDYIEAIELRLYNNDQSETDFRTSYIHKYMNYDFFFLDQIINSSFCIDLKFDKLEPIYPTLVHIKSSIKEFLELPRGVKEQDRKNEEVKSKKEQIYDQLKLGDGVRLKDQESEKTRKVEIEKFRKNNIKANQLIDSIKSLYKPGNIIEFNQIIANIDRVDFRMNYRVFNLERDTIADHNAVLNLCKFTEIFRHIKELRINNIDVSDSIKELLPHTWGFKEIKTLRMLRSQDLDKFTYTLIGKCVDANAGIKKVIIDSCMSGENIQEIITQIRGRDLLLLNLNNNVISLGGARCLANCCHKFQKLKYLYLKNNELGVGGMSYLSSAFSKLTFLEILDVSHNNLNGEALYLLFKGVYKLNFLMLLDISSNGTENFAILEERKNEYDRSEDYLISNIILEFLPQMKSLMNLIIDMTASRGVVKDIMNCKNDNCRVYKKNEGQQVIVKPGADY